MPEGTSEIAVSDELKEIQGGVIGFNKNHERFLYGNFLDRVSAQAFLGEITPQIANGYEVTRFNEAFSENRRHEGDPEAIQATWVNIWLSRSGLSVLEASGLEAFPPEFASGMAARANVVGDLGVSAPETWQAPFTGGAEPHIVIVLAGDNLLDLDARLARVEELAARHSVQIIGRQDGEARPGDLRGHEHFGFKDGVSQPGIEKFTKKGNGGTIPPGDVFIGYPDSEGNISGQPITTPAPAPTPYDPAPAQPPTQPLPDWTRNGSFVVLRKLRQDVAAFNAATNSSASAVGLSPEQLAAKTVGRWPSGAPMERVPGCPAHIDPSVTDPSIEAPVVLEKEKINAFNYSDDADGNLVPRGSHVRKMNPRADVLPDGDTADKHRLIRRGITYGPEFQAGEPAYGTTVSDTQDRGLLFVNYQSSIARFFEFVQSRWANREDFQKPGDGKDPIISQDTPDGIFSIPPHGQVTFARWVTTVGGGYFFAPSVPALRKLAGG